MANREVTTSGSHLANALVTPTGAATDVTLANVAQVALNGMRTTDTIAALTAISSPAANQLVYVRGYHTPGDGGGGMFMWDAASTDQADNGLVFSADGLTTGRWKRLYKEQQKINVKWFGAVGDKIANDTAAIQAALDTGLAVYVPRGNYLVSSLLMRGTKHFLLEGEHSWAEGSRASRIMAIDNVASDEPLIHRQEGWLGADGIYTNGQGGTPPLRPPYVQGAIRNIDLYVGENNVLKSVIDFWNTRNVVIDNITILTPFRGITAGVASFETAITNVRISSYYSDNNPWSAEGALEKAKRAWGIYAAGHTYMHNIASIGNGVGVYMTGAGVTLQCSRIETNNYGVIVGTLLFDVDGYSSSVLENGAVIGVSTEGGNYGFYIEDGQSSIFSGLRSWGHAWESAKSLVGVYIRKLNRTCSLENIFVKNNWRDSCITNYSSVQITNSGVDSAGVAAVTQPFLTGPNDGFYIPRFSFINSLIYPSASQEGSKHLTHFNNLMLGGLTGINLRDIGSSGYVQGGFIFAQNLGGTISPVSEATTTQVLFATSKSRLNNGMNSPLLVSDAASTLLPRTYFYAGTLVGLNGETPIQYQNLNGLAPSYFSVTVSAGQKVQIRPKGTGEKGYITRIYRGIIEGSFEGFINRPLDDHSSFYDDGTISFSNKGAPPDNLGTANLPGREEFDANYQIVATPSWGTTVHVTNKTTTGFTLNFGTAAPDANQKVAWLLFRP